MGDPDYIFVLIKYFARIIFCAALLAYYIRNTTKATSTVIIPKVAAKAVGILVCFW